MLNQMSTHNGKDHHPILEQPGFTTMNKKSGQAIAPDRTQFQRISKGGAEPFLSTVKTPPQNRLHLYQPRFFTAKSQFRSLSITALA